MPMFDLKKKREEYAALHKENGDAIELAAKENREPTAEEIAAAEVRYTKLDKLQTVIDAQTKFAKYAVEGTGDKGTVTLPRDPAGKAETDADPDRQQFSAVTNPAKIDKLEFGRAVTEWARTGKMDRRFATITTATQGGILLPKKVMAPLVPTTLNAFREGYAAWGVEVMDTAADTSQMAFPIITPNAGGVVAENASSETENASDLGGSFLSTPKTYQSGAVYYSNLQLEATGFDLLQASIPSLRLNKELGLEAAIVAAMIADAGITQTVPTASVSGLTWANFVQLNQKLPKRFQSMKVIVLSADAMAAAEGLVDDQHRPIMIGDTQNQNLKRIGGTPVVRSDYLAGFGANNVVGLIFTLSGFHLRDAGEHVIRYDQVINRPDQIGINLFGYHAYAWTPLAVAKLKCPAS